MKTRELYLAKLESSGLTEQDGAWLGMEPLTPQATQALSFDPRPSLYIPYWDPMNSKAPLRHKPEWPQLYRIRYLGEDCSFKAQTTEKPKRYMQPAGIGLGAYFTRLPNVKWPEIIQDCNVPLIITEGELKAAKTCKEGFPCIGLGGVFSYKSGPGGIPFLPELAKINWVRRNVYLIYDSDFRTNPNIIHSINELSEELMLRGATPMVVCLPELPDVEKTGLDDFLVARGREELEALICNDSREMTLAKSLFELNEKVVFVGNPGLVVDKKSGQKMTPGSFKEAVYSDELCYDRVLGKDGKPTMRRVPIAPTWMSWPLRSKVAKLTYAPGRVQHITNCEFHNSAWNVWPGWGCQPCPGDVTPFLELIDHLFSDTEPAAKTWFLQWLAYPLQYPGTKLFTSAVIYGIKHGTGKSMVGYTVQKIYGKNWTEIRQQDLHGSFNSWAENKQFVLGDDITGSDNRLDADVLKKLITQSELRVNAKFMPEYTVPDCINYLFTSNQPTAFFLEDNDRRFFIHEVQVDPLPEVFYADYSLWLAAGGAEAIFDYLLHVDTSDFNPAAPALRTRAKDRMTHDVKSDLASWVARLHEDPDSVLRLGDVVMNQELFTNKQLLSLYDPGQRTKVTANGLGRELKKAGFRQVLDGALIQLSDGKDRLYAVRAPERWQRATRAQVQAYATKNLK
jgi:hypothetical protein